MYRRTASTVYHQGSFILQHHSLFTYAQKDLGVKLKFARRKVGVSSEESPTLLRGNSQRAGRPQKGRF